MFLAERISVGEAAVDALLGYAVVFFGICLLMAVVMLMGKYFVAQDNEPKTAAMIMAIVADKLQKPLNELRFISIKEVK